MAVRSTGCTTSRCSATSASFQVPSSAFAPPTCLRQTPIYISQCNLIKMLKKEPSLAIGGAEIAENEPEQVSSFR